MSFLNAARCAVLALAAANAASANCTIYEHRDYGGASWWLDAGDTMKMINDPSCWEEDGETVCTSTSHWVDPTIYEPSWNDNVSSFRVGRGCSLILWEHVNAEGAYFDSDTSYKYLGDDWNDQTSEATCTCD